MRESAICVSFTGAQLIGVWLEIAPSAPVTRRRRSRLECMHACPHLRPQEEHKGGCMRPSSVLLRHQHQPGGWRVRAHSWLLFGGRIEAARVRGGCGCRGWIQAMPCGPGCALRAQAAGDRRARAAAWGSTLPCITQQHGGAAWGPCYPAWSPRYPACAPTWWGCMGPTLPCMAHLASCGMLVVGRHFRGKRTVPCAVGGSGLGSGSGEEVGEWQECEERVVGWMSEVGGREVGGSLSVCGSRHGPPQAPLPHQ